MSLYIRSSPPPAKPVHHICPYRRNRCTISVLSVPCHTLEGSIYMADLPRSF